MFHRRGLILGGGAVFTPASIAGLKLWLDASRITGLVDGDPVATWIDLSGQGNHATQATASKKPLYKTGIVNSKPVVRLDGVDDEVGTPTISQLSGGATMMIVWRPRVLPASNIRHSGIQTSSTDHFRFMTVSGTGVVRAYVNNTLSDAAALVAGTASIMGNVWSNTTVTGYKDGAAGTPGSGITPTTVTAAAFRIGGIDSTFPDGDVAEVVLYSVTLTTGQRQQVESYLRQKWGTP